MNRAEYIANSKAEQVRRAITERYGTAALPFAAQERLAEEFGLNHRNVAKIREAMYRRLYPRPAQRMVQLKCTRCAASFVRPWSAETKRIREGKIGPFCGRSCTNHWYLDTGRRSKPPGTARIHLERNCDYCAKPYLPEYAASRFCSLQCLGISRRKHPRWNQPRWNQPESAEPSPAPPLSGLDAALWEAMR